MTQANDLGAIANQQAAFYRARVNANFQACVSWHYGVAEPATMYQNMIWFSAGDGFIKVRSPTNSSWQNVGLIGPPMKWTNVDLPQEMFTVGDVKGSYNPTQPAGWLHLNDGTIGNQFSVAQSRSNPDCWPLFNLLWSISADDWCPVFASGTLSRTGRGASSASDWNANRHIGLPKVLGRVPGAAGWGATLSNWPVATWGGAESAALSINQMPPHPHAFSTSMPAHVHGLSAIVDNFGQPHQGGVFGEGTGNLQITNRQTDGGGGGTIAGVTSSAGGGAPVSLMQATTFIYYFIKL